MLLAAGQVGVVVPELPDELEVVSVEEESPAESEMAGEELYECGQIIVVRKRRRQCGPVKPLRTLMLTTGSAVELLSLSCASPLQGQPPERAQ